MNMFSRTFQFLVSLILLVAIWAPLCAAQPSQSSAKSALRFSLIPKRNVDQQLADFKPLLDLLEEKLQRPIKVVRPQSYQSVIEGLLSNSIDFAILGPASYTMAKKRDNRIEAFASFSQKEGFSTPRGSYYNSLLITLKDREITSIDDLRGKKVAFTDPASTSGSIIPSVQFAKVIGQPIDRFFGSQIYTGSHDRSIKAVVKGWVDAAFVASSRLDEEVLKRHADPQQIVILWRSQNIHYDPFVFGSHLDESLREQIRNIILSPSPELQEMCANMQREGIVPVSDADYLPIHEIAAQKRKQDQ